MTDFEKVIDFENMYRAWKNHISHGNCYKLSKQMDKIIQNIFKENNYG